MNDMSMGTYTEAIFIKEKPMEREPILGRTVSPILETGSKD